MKITHVSPYFYPHIGGVEIHVKEISELSVAKGDKVGVITLQHDKKLKLIEQQNNVRIYRIDKFRDKYSVWQWIWKNKKIFINSDVVHVHDVFWWILPIWPLIRKKVFITFHGWEGIYPVPLKNKLQRWLWAKLSRANLQVGDYIREFYWEKPNEVIYGGISPLAFSQVSDLSPFPSSGEGDKDKLSVVFLGRLEKVNEIETYIKIIRELKQNNFKIKMLWVGDGALRDDCGKVGKVTGFIKDQEKYLATSDIVFANSYLSILKAQAMGKLVVAVYSNKLKQSYLVNYPGSKYMLVANSKQQVADKLLELLRKKKKILKMQKSAKNFANKMTWEKILKTYYKLWQIKK